MQLALHQFVYRSSGPAWFAAENRQTFKSRSRKQYTRHHIRVHDLLAGERIDAIVRKRRRHNRKIARRHQHRALAEIHVQNGANVAFNDKLRRR
jgi:hypothetical protein